jgi:hypothetical protein
MSTSNTSSVIVRTNACRCKGLDEALRRADA